MRISTTTSTIIVVPTKWPWLEVIAQVMSLKRNLSHNTTASNHPSTKSKNSSRKSSKIWHRCSSIWWTKVFLALTSCDRCSIPRSSDVANYYRNIIYRPTNNKNKRLLLYRNPSQILFLLLLQHQFNYKFLYQCPCPHQCQSRNRSPYPLFCNSSSCWRRQRLLLNHKTTMEMLLVLLMLMLLLSSNRRIRVRRTPRTRRQATVMVMASQPIRGSTWTLMATSMTFRCWFSWCKGTNTKQTQSDIANWIGWTLCSLIIGISSQRIKKSK